MSAIPLRSVALRSNPHARSRSPQLCTSRLRASAFTPSVILLSTKQATAVLQRGAAPPHTKCSSGEVIFGGVPGKVGQVDFMVPVHAPGETGGMGQALFGGEPGKVGLASFDLPSTALPSAGGIVGALSRWNRESARLRERINALGLAGVASYGLFNTIYYVSSFLFIWFCVVKVERGTGVAATARRVGEVLAMTWAGSQVTKLIRAGAALALAPAMERVLQALQNRLRCSKGAAFAALTVACFALSFSVFGAAILVCS
mmetsp:Transcript_7913/g.26390  ORF Transcript_7913/g.26390 Transcript_7913/m.26390 type:complete len:259 (-) Transcript_7913:68-844(-)